MSNEIREIIEMETAIEILKTSRTTFYRWLRSGKIKGMKAGRQWRFYRDDIERFMAGLEPEIEIRGDFAPLAKAIAAEIEKRGGSIPDFGSAEEVEKVISSIILLAITTKASDIHLAAHQNSCEEGVIAALKLRINGEVDLIATFDHKLLRALIDKIKIKSQCDINERSIPQDGRMLYNVGDERLDMRLNFMPTIFGESMVARIINVNVATCMFSLEKTGMYDDQIEQIRKTLSKNNGVILSSGPTCSGKTTVMYSILKEFDGTYKNIVTVENPVEVVIPWATQLQVNHKKGMSTVPLLKSVLRSDPDIVIVHDIDQNETLGLTLQLGLSTLVVAQTHSFSSAMALSKMMEMEDNMYLLCDTFKIITSQRLLKKICPHCRKKKEMSELDRERLANILEETHTRWDGDFEFYSAEGCSKCSRGHQGRVAASELMAITPKLKKAIIQRSGEDELQKLAVKEGMRPMVIIALEKAQKGETSIEEILSTFE